MFPKFINLPSSDFDDFILENSLEIFDDRFLIVEIFIWKSFGLKLITEVFWRHTNPCHGISMSLRFASGISSTHLTYEPTWVGSGLITRIGQWPRERLQTWKPSDICRSGWRHVANLSGGQTWSQSGYVFCIAACRTWWLCFVTFALECKALSLYLPVLHETSLRHSLDLPITIQRLAGYSQGLSLGYNRWPAQRS